MHVTVGMWLGVTPYVVGLYDVSAQNGANLPMLKRPRQVSVKHEAVDSEVPLISRSIPDTGYR